jgi:parvulin-like peptidyl-prolyl isomerase
MKTTAVLLCSLALVFGSAGCRRDLPSGSPPAARVNGRAIPLATIDASARKDLLKKAKFGTDPSSPEALDHHRRQRLEEAIREELLVQASESIEVPGLDDQVEAQLREMSESPPEGGRKPPEITEELKTRVRRKLRVERYLAAQGLSDPPIDEGELHKLYESTKASLRNPESMHVRHVLVKPVDGTPIAKAAAKAKASEVLAEIRAGKTTFEDAARKHSACNSAASGGDLGEVAMGFMPAPFERAALALAPGGIGGPVETTFGYHLVQLVAKKPAYTPDYSAARPFLAKYLKDNASTRLIAAHIEQLRAKSKVEVLVP